MEIAETLSRNILTPAVSLSSNTRSKSGITPVTINGNTFGGSAISMTISLTGSGTESPTSFDSVKLNVLDHVIELIIKEISCLMILAFMFPERGMANLLPGIL